MRLQIRRTRTNLLKLEFNVIYQTPKGKGMAISWRGAKAYQTSSLKIGRLNSTPLVFEVEADQNWDGWHRHSGWNRELDERASMILSAYFLTVTILSC
jgi:hypothetical protein